MDVIGWSGESSNKRVAGVLLFLTGDLKKKKRFYGAESLRVWMPFAVQTTGLRYGSVAGAKRARAAHDNLYKSWGRMAEKFTFEPDRVVTRKVNRLFLTQRCAPSKLEDSETSSAPHLSVFIKEQHVSTSEVNVKDLLQRQTFPISN